MQTANTLECLHFIHLSEPLLVAMVMIPKFHDLAEICLSGAQKFKALGIRFLCYNEYRCILVVVTIFITIDS